MNGAWTALHNAVSVCSWTLLACAGIIGCVAVCSPQAFRRLAERGAHWLDTDKIFAKLDRRFDVDRLLLPYSRWLGAAVVATVAILCFRFSVL